MAIKKKQLINTAKNLEEERLRYFIRETTFLQSAWSEGAKMLSRTIPLKAEEISVIQMLDVKQDLEMIRIYTAIRQSDFLNSDKK